MAIKIKLHRISVLMVLGFGGCASINLQPVQPIQCSAEMSSNSFCAAVDDVTNQRDDYARRATRRDRQSQLVTGASVISGIAAASAVGFEANSDLLTGTALAVGFSGPVADNLNLSDRAKVDAAGANAMACILDHSRLFTGFNHDMRSANLTKAAGELKDAVAKFKAEAKRIEDGEAGCPNNASKADQDKRSILLRQSELLIAEARVENGLLNQAENRLGSARSAVEVLSRLDGEILKSQAAINATVLTRADGLAPNLEQLIEAITSFRLPNREPESTDPAPQDESTTPSRPILPGTCSAAPNIIELKEELESKSRGVSALSADNINQSVVSISRCPLIAASSGG